MCGTVIWLFVIICFAVNDVLFFSTLANSEVTNAAPVYYQYSRASLVNGKGARYVQDHTEESITEDSTV